MSGIQIENIAQAQEAAAAIADFWRRFNQSLAVLGNLTGKSNGEEPSRLQTRSHGNLLPLVSPPTHPALKAAPESMAERIFEILRYNHQPMTPKEMVEKYIEFQWPQPKNGKIYSQLLSSAYYLAQKGRLAKNGGRYSMPVAATEVKI